MPRTVNPQVAGSSPARGAKSIKGIGPLGTEYVPTSAEHGDGTGPYSPPLSPGVSQAIQATWERRLASMSVPSGAKDPRQLDLFHEIRNPGL